MGLMALRKAMHISRDHKTSGANREQGSHARSMLRRTNIAKREADECRDGWAALTTLKQLRLG